jgi:hypothetical protein
MEFTKNDLATLINIRAALIEKHKRIRSYKSNKNAIMKEVDHVVLIESVIKEMDVFLKKFVEFN